VPEYGAAARIGIRTNISCVAGIAQFTPKSDETAEERQTVMFPFWQREYWAA